MAISIIIPILNDASILEASLQALQPYRSRGNEVLVVDGGSRDGSVTLARPFVDRVLMSGAGRALQMNSGSEYASHEIFLFLYPGMRLPDNADVLVEDTVNNKGAQWGYFELGGGSLWERFKAGTVNGRAEVSGLAAGEQTIFVTRRSFERAKGFDMVPADEGQALSKKLLELAKPVCVKMPVTPIKQGK